MHNDNNVAHSNMHMISDHATHAPVACARRHVHARVRHAHVRVRVCAVPVGVVGAQRGGVARVAAAVEPTPISTAMQRALSAPNAKHCFTLT